MLNAALQFTIIFFKIHFCLGIIYIRLLLEILVEWKKSNRVPRCEAFHGEFRYCFPKMYGMPI